MATKKPSTGAPTTRTPSSTKARARPSAQLGRVRARERAQLLALDPSFDAKLDVSVKNLLDEGRDLVKCATKDREALLGGTDLRADFAKELEARIDLLERAEDDWDDERTRRANRSVAAAREVAERRKSVSFRALRYFLRADGEVQARLDEIAEGSGDADLVDDCRRLSHLVEAHALALKKAKLGVRPAEGLRAAADGLAGATSDDFAETSADDSLGLRNRAFWSLRQTLDEVRAAGRYVFADDPRRLTKYRSTLTLARARHRTKKVVTVVAEKPTQG